MVKMLDESNTDIISPHDNLQALATQGWQP